MQAFKHHQGADMSASHDSFTKYETELRFHETIIGLRDYCDNHIKELRQEHKELRQEHKEEMKSLREEIKSAKWQVIGTFFTVVTLSAGYLTFVVKTAASTPGIA